MPWQVNEGRPRYGLPIGKVVESRDSLLIAYKYINRQFLGSWEKGVILVNTTENIRTQFEKGPISDAKEAWAKNSFDDYSYSPEVDAPSQWNAFAAATGFSTNDGLPPHYSLRLRNGHIISSLKNAFSFCTANHRNDDEWSKIPESEGGPYDCSIKIKDIKKLCLRLEAEITKTWPIEKTLIFSCHYDFNSAKYPEQPFKKPNYFRKEPRLDWQTEKKAIFYPREGVEISPAKGSIEVSDLISIVY